jgi:hypothetical protein
LEYLLLLYEYSTSSGKECKSAPSPSSTLNPKTVELVKGGLEDYTTGKDNLVKNPGVYYSQ